MEIQYPLRGSRKQPRPPAGMASACRGGVGGPAYEERGSEQDKHKVGYSPQGEEAPSGAPTGKKGHKERLTMAETHLDVLEASVEVLYQGQGRLLWVESSQEEAESWIEKVESLLINRHRTPRIPYDIYMKL
ncbi:hypothetical protein GW17_00059852 [Ensete ventricosum]|nr:hypothetical protein GW17_00059852 [Ensete ventricosum]